MIISAPTGLYKPIIKDSGSNITYTISNSDIPKIDIHLQKLPVINQTHTTNERVHDDETRRSQFGKLVFNITKSSDNIAGSNTKLFETGEILEFSNLTPIDEINNARIQDEIEIRHDVNILDLNSLGLTDSDIDNISKSAREKLTEFEKLFAEKQLKLKTIDADILELQKKMNENSKALNASKIIFDIDDINNTDNEIIIKLNNNNIAFNNELKSLIDEKNIVSDELKVIIDNINKLSKLVR